MLFNLISPPPVFIALRAIPFNSSRRRRRRLKTERLESRQMLAAELMISEFLASNSSDFVDGAGRTSDWIEIYNAGDQPQNLASWHLTDSPTDLDRWTFPSDVGTLDPGAYLIIFASGDGVPDSQGQLHSNFQLSASGDYLALTRPDLSIASEFGPTGSDFPPQRSNISYGIDLAVQSGDATRYFLTPTPGAANANPIQGFVQDTQFSVDRGYFDQAFDVEITSQTIDATIVYTTDGSAPTLTNGTQVNAVPGTTPIATVPISTTTTLRAAAFRSEYQSTDVDTQTYLFLDDVINQPAAPSGLPTQWGSAPAADYEMDPEITSDPTYQQDLLAGLRELPAVSLVSDVDGLFGAGGIYSNPENDSLEIPVSAEYVLPDGNSGFQIDAGLKIAGGASRRPNNSPKHSMSLRFRSQYGDAKLNYDLFDGSPVNEFNSLQLRAVYNNSWIHWDQGQRGRGTLIRDQFVRDSLIAAGQDDAGRGHYTHVYINGLYWGVYNLHERADASHFSEHNGGSPDDYDALNGGVAIDGTINSWDNLKLLVANKQWAEITAALDVDNFIDWTLVQAFGGNADLKTNGNWRAAGGGPANAPWRMFAWDSERILEGVTAKPPNSLTDATGMFAGLMQIPEFVVRLGDRIQSHFTGNGAFTPARAQQRWLERSAQLQNAIVAESARWGDYRRDVHPRGATPLLYRRDQNWTPEVNRVANDYFEARVGYLMNQFVTDGWLPATAAPAFRVDGVVQAGGAVIPGTTLRLTDVPVEGVQNAIYYTTDGSDPRLPGGALSSSAIAYDSTSTTSTLIDSQSTWKYDDRGIDLGTAWRTPTFDDNAWASGPAQLGFGDGDEATIVSFGSDANNKHRTTYFRKSFDVTSTDLTQLTLRIRRDDGAAVYLNGTEIARDNLPAGNIQYSTRALAAAADDGNAWITFDIPVQLLQTGSNTLAVDVHQNSPTSSDLSFDAELVAQIQMSPGIQLNETADIHARVRNDSGDWSALHHGLFLVPNEPASSSNVRLTEIHYHPKSNSDAEFLELTNITNDTVVDLDGVTIVDGPSVPFQFPPNTRLNPGERVVVVADLLAFESVYPHIPSHRIAGSFAGKLSNSGERIRILDVEGNIITDVDYSDSSPWSEWADGLGGSLVLDPEQVQAAESGKPYRYRGSTEIGGSPGQENLPRPGIVINEVLAHTDAPQSDSIELHNLTSEPIDIGGYFLSDDGANPQKYRIAEGTVIAAGAFLVFDESDFNPPLPTATSLQPFGLSGSRGESLWLFQGDGNIVEAFIDQAEFDATYNGVSVGRVAGGGSRFVPLANVSLGSLNGTFRPSTVEISEINYHPGPPSAAAITLEPTLTETDLEFIELRNVTDTSQSLQNWRLRGEGDFDFASTDEIAAHGTVVIVSFDPNDPQESNRRAAFETHYGISSTVQILGPFSGSLNNHYGVIKLQSPDEPPSDDPLFVPNVTIDEVFYDDLAPWPIEADGAGKSLQRIASRTLGNYALSWRGETPTPGTVPERATIESVTIDDGTTSRSNVSELVVQFDRQVEIDPAAVQIRNRESGAEVDQIQLALTVVDAKTVATISFGTSDSIDVRSSGNSLKDGNYELAIDALGVRSLGTDTTMDASYLMGQQASDNFFRLYGDLDGDRHVDVQERGQIASAIAGLSTTEPFKSQLDFDGNGEIDLQDLNQFSLRYRRKLPF